MKDSSIDGRDSQTVLNEIVLEHMREQRRTRKWRWLKRFGIFLLISWFLYQIFYFNYEDKRLALKPHIGLIDVKGEIFEEKSANGDNFVKSLDAAYSNKSMKAVIVRIDSPGGSPVQADYMYTALQSYKNKFPDIKTYAVCVDICASAAYYVAAASDEIYANPASMVGSIGVIYSGFGFVDTLQKVGVTRRLQTAGNNKDFLDPFTPVLPGQEQKLQVMLDIVHQQFIEKVKEGRGDRLRIDDEIFSGLFWTGVQAKERGLIDGFASSGQLARETIKIDQIIDYTYKDSVFERVAKHMGVAMVDRLPKALGLQARFE